jgi:hypothetical protein
MESECEDVSMPVEVLVQPGVGSGDGQQDSAANVEPEYVIMNATDNNEEPAVPICVRGQGLLARGQDNGQEGGQSSGNVELDYEMNALEDGRREGVLMESDQNHDIVSAGGLVQDHCSDNRQHSSVYSNAPDEDEKPKDTTKSECEPVNAPGPAVEDQSSDYVIMDATDSDEKLEDTSAPDSGGPAEDEGSLGNQQQESQ